MEDLENEFKDLKKKNKALRHHLKEEAVTGARQSKELIDIKSQLQTKSEKVDELQQDNSRLTKRIQVLQDLENKRQQDQATSQSSNSYFGSSFFSGNNTTQVQQMKEELKRVNEDLSLAQEELIAKIQENEMVNIKIFDIEKEFNEKEKALDTRINDLQKRQYQLEQEVSEKENEIQKLRNELQIVSSQNQMQQTNIQNMEVKFTDEQSKWINLCERVGNQMESNKYVYQSKFPMDPFRRDNTFQYSALLQKEMQNAINSTQRKTSSQPFGKNKNNMALQQEGGEIIDFNHLNVIKTDFKTFQRQKEIITVISDMSCQISTSLTKCISSFASQIDGQKPVDSKIIEDNNSAQILNKNKGQSKGDVSQQIMETHGQRIKKYGIYIGQLVEKLRSLQLQSQELFDTISVQAAQLIDHKTKIHEQSQILNYNENDNNQGENNSQKHELGQRNGAYLTQGSISTSSEKISAILNDVQDILENFYEEEQILFQAGIDLQFQEYTLKNVNDSIMNNISNLQQHLLTLKQKDDQEKKASYVFKLPNKINQYEIIQMIVSSSFDKFTALFKGEIQSLAQNLLKKKDIFKNEGCKLLINGQLSKSGMPFEVQSNNAMFFREQLVADFMEQSHLLERYHTACLSAKNLFQHSNTIMNQNHQKQELKQPRINIQISINKSVMRAKNRLANLGQNLDNAQKAISYEEQMRNMQLLELNKKEMIQIKAELFTVKKDNEKLDQEQQKQGIGFQKYKTLAKIEQDKACKLTTTVNQVDSWLSDLKGIVNFEDTISETPTNEADGFLNNSIRQLEHILSNKQQLGTNQETMSDQKQSSISIDQKQFFDIKQILKLNNDSNSKFHHLTKQAMVPEDIQPKFQLKKALQSSISLQQIKNSNQPQEKNILSDPNDRQLIPLNYFINSEQSSIQRMQIIQQSYLQKVNQLTQKLFQVDRLSQGTSLQVLQKENEWKDKVQKIEVSHQTAIDSLKKEVEQAQTDKQLISKSYESQLQMMSDALVEMQNDNQGKNLAKQNNL